MKPYNYFILYTAAGTLTINSFPSEICYEMSYDLICNHPDFTTNTDFFPEVYWQRNNIPFVPEDGRITRVDTTSEKLTVTVIEGVNANDSYCCFLIILNNLAKQESDHVSPNNACEPLK